MKEIIQYQIEVAICMIALTLLYMIVWRKDTNFSVKRLLLLIIPLFSLIIPLINLGIDVQPKPESSTIQYISYLPSQLELVYTPIVEKAETFSGWEIAFWIFAIGTGIMFVRLLVSYFKIWQLFQQSTMAATGKFRLIDDPIQSFSFFNLIMINRLQAASSERNYILAHEKAHSRQGHSYDVLLLEIIKTLHWFNPFIWLITRESKQNMEYLADQEVTTKTQNIENYQYAIVSHATNSDYQLLKTQFSKSNLKNRIIMMNRPNNQKIKAGKLGLLLPVLAILFMSFSVNVEHLDIKRELSEVLPVFNPTGSNIKESTNFPLVKKIEASKKNEFKTESNKAVISEKKSQIATRKIEGTIKTENGDPVVGCNVIIKGTNIGTITDGEGKFLMEVEPEHSELVFSYVGLLSEMVPITDETNYKIVLSNDPEYASSTNTPSKVAIGHPLLTDPNGITISVADSINVGPLFIIDGNINQYEMSEINPNDIESISVLKNKDAIVRYGELGVNGVILITTKKSQESVYTDVSIVDDNNRDGLKLRTEASLDIDKENPPLIYKDGIEISIDVIEKIDPASIQSIEVIKDESAISTYGERGKNGVIIITSKK